MPLALVIVAVVGGCPGDSRAPDGSEDERAAAKEHAPPAETKSEVRATGTAGVPVEAAGEGLERLSAERAAELRTQFLARLNEGRALTKGGKHEEGIGKYLEALALDPSDPAALAELGWAAFLSNQFDLARKTTRRALDFAREDEQKGMLLYNLGRIAEAEGDLTTAIEHYRASLDHRENATVTKRLDAALAAVAVAPPVAGGGLRSIATGLGDLEAACTRLQKHDACSWAHDTGEERCACAPTMEASLAGDPTWGFLAVETNMQKTWFPVVKTDAGWVLFELVVWAYNPGAFGIYEEAQVEAPSAGEPLADGAATVAWRFTKHRHDRDMGLNEIEFEDERALMVCARKGDSAWCTAPVVESSSYGRELEFPEEDDPSIEHTEGVPFSSRYEATLELRDRKLIVSEPRVSTTGKGRDVSGHQPAGEYDLDALLGRKTE